MNKKHNFWGDSDDVEPLPDWMNPKTYQQSNRKRRSKTLEEAINDVLKKPALIQENQQISLQEHSYAQREKEDY